MTTSDDLSTGILLLGGGLAGYAAGRFLLSRVLDERERGAAPSVALTFAGSGPLALAAPSTALIDPYSEPATTSAPPSPPAHVPSQLTPGPATAPGQVATSAPATPIDPYTVPPTTKPARVPSKPPLSRAFDPVFETYRGSIPIEFLRALATRESGMGTRCTDPVLPPSRA